MAEDPQPKARKSANGAALRTYGNRHQRLKLHLLVGFLMVTIAMGGYAFLGPEAHAASRAEYRMNYWPTIDHLPQTGKQTVAGNGIMQVNTNSPSGSTGVSPAGDISAVQAEMDEITRRLNTLKSDGFLPIAASDYSSSGRNGLPANTQSSGISAGEVLSTLDQMTSILHQMMAELDRIESQSGGTSNPVSSTGSH